MDVITIVGKKNVEFKGEKGETVRGVSLFYLMDAPNVEGKETGKYFMSDAKVKSLSYMPRVGDAVRVYYNRFGKPEDFAICPSGK